MPRMNPQQTILDPDKVIALFGTATEMHRALTEVGVKMSKDSINVMVHRGKIAAHCVPWIICACVHRKIPVDLKSLYKVVKPTPTKSPTHDSVSATA